MKCHSCNTELKGKTKFCPECGEKVLIVQEVEQPQTVKMILKFAEAADFLRISKPTLYDLLNDPENPIPYLPIKADKRFITSELIEWAKKSQKTLSNIQRRKAIG